MVIVVRDRVSSVMSMWLSNYGEVFNFRKYNFFVEV